MDKLDLDAIEARFNVHGDLQDMPSGHRTVAKLCAALRRLQAAALPVEEQGPRPVDAREKIRKVLDAADKSLTIGHAGKGMGASIPCCPAHAAIDEAREALDALTARPKAEEGKAVDGQRCPGCGCKPSEGHDVECRANGWWDPTLEAEEGKAEPRPGGLRSIEQAAREYVEAERNFIDKRSVRNPPHVRQEAEEGRCAAWTNLCVAVDGWKPDSQAPTAQSAPPPAGPTSPSLLEAAQAMVKSMVWVKECTGQFAKERKAWDDLRAALAEAQAGEAP